VVILMPKNPLDIGKKEIKIRSGGDNYEFDKL
jgi:hypothetical protein